MILNASRLSTVLIAGHFGNKLYQIPLDNTYQTYSANTRAIAELQKASPTCSVCTSSSAKHYTNGRMRVRANRTRLRPGSTRFSRPSPRPMLRSIHVVQMVCTGGKSENSEFTSGQRSIHTKHQHEWPSYGYCVISNLYF